jgi:hypothetical protein
MGTEVSSLYVLHGVADDNRRVLILGPINDDAEAIPEGPYFMQSDVNLCPPACDASFSAATPIDQATAERYVERFRASGLDEVRAFLIPHRVINALSRSTDVRTLRVCNGLRDGSRNLIVAGAGPRGESINTTIYLQDQSTLCPPACDFYGEPTAPSR